MTKTSLESCTPDQKLALVKPLSSIERRKLKKIAVEKRRRARMNRSLAALRDLLQDEDGELEDADTAQVLDMAVTCLRRCRKLNPETYSGDLARPHPYNEVTISAAPSATYHPTAHAPPPMYNAFSDADLHKLVEYQNEVDRMDFQKQQQQQACADAMRLCHPFGDVFPVFGYPEGLLLRNLVQAVPPVLLDARGATPWRPW